MNDVLILIQKKNSIILVPLNLRYRYNKQINLNYTLYLAKALKITILICAFLSVQIKKQSNEGSTRLNSYMYIKYINQSLMDTHFRPIPGVELTIYGAKPTIIDWPAGQTARTCRPVYR